VVFVILEALRPVGAGQEAPHPGDRQFTAATLLLILFPGCVPNPLLKFIP
jgi:hypothetical protein